MIGLRVPDQTKIVMPVVGLFTLTYCRNPSK